MALITGSPQDNEPLSWHFSSGNQTSDSFSKTIFWTGRSSIRSSCPLRVLPASSRTLLTTPSESLCTWTTFAIGHWLRLASIFKSTISSMTNYLRFFYFWQDWGADKNSFLHICQNSLAMGWPRLQRILLNSSALTNSPGGGITTLVVIVKILFGLNGCSLLTSPKVSTVKGPEFDIASVSASSVLNDSSFKLLPCVTNNNNRMLNLPLPNCPHMTCFKRVSIPNDVVRTKIFKKVLNILMVHLLQKHFCKFSLGSNKIWPIIVTQDFYISSSCYDLSQDFDQWIIVHITSAFNMDYPAC